MAGRLASVFGRSRCSLLTNLTPSKVSLRIGKWHASESRPFSTWLSRNFFPSRRSVLSSASFRVYNAVANPSQRVVEAPKEAHGFLLQRREYIREYDSDALLYVHKKTGAEVMSVVNKDENKCFGVVFRTPVSDSTGVPHILEHSVLCGSQKYPIKEPFVELLKGSLQTFLNAMTFPDRTAYPVASCNTQDFYNLMDVYLDAVFFPNCLSDPRIFAQEGWHYEIEKDDEPITYKGVVFNEMKGIYSSPDALHYHNGTRYLFPDNTYQHDSGGDPVVIPNLTYDQFKNFHQTYYHPSNSRIWVYGDDDPVKRLELLNNYLERFDRKEVDSRVNQQPLFEESKKITDSFPAGEGDKTFASVHWVLSSEPFDTKTKLATEFLNFLLLGTPASPLYKKLNDSNLGEAVLGYGYGDYLRQPTYSVGMKGVHAENVDKVETAVMDELKRLASEGFSENAIEAAMNTIEFSLRENNTGRFPRGLALMNRIFDDWNYDQDPFEPMKWEEPLNDLKKQLASDPKVFQTLIKDLFLNNQHRVMYEMHPDTELSSKQAKGEEKKLNDLKSKMKADQIQEQIKLTTELKLRQETPDSPEDLKCVPLLKLEDIPKEAPKIPTRVLEENGRTFLFHDIFTNDILYFTLAMDMTSLPSRLIPMVPLFCECLTEMGTEKNDFVQLTELIGRKTGGLAVSPMTSNKRGTEAPVAKILVTGKATKDKIEDLMSITKEILLDVKLDDKDRFKQLVLETKAGLESSIISGGHSFAVKRLSAQRSIASAAGELMSGVSYISFVRELVERVDNDWNGVLSQLEECRKYLINMNQVTVNLTADEETMSSAKSHIDTLLDSLPSVDNPVQEWDILLPQQNEAFTVPTQVNYIGKGVNLFKESDYEVTGSTGVITKHVYASWLWDRVRVSGGAYGCLTGLDTDSGVLTFVSYRDPNLMETVDVYEKTAEFLKETEMDEDSLRKAIIGAIGSVDAYQLPDAKGNTAMMRHFLEIDDVWRQERRDELLGTTTKDFVKFGEYVEAIKSENATVVAVTSQERAEEVTKNNPGYWKVNKIL